MDQTALIATVKREIAGYARAHGINTAAHFVANDQETLYAVLAVDQRSLADPSLMVMAQVVDQQVLIYCDRTDVSVFETLVEAGIPATQIVRAAQGESFPALTSASSA